jgi:hypothetical protein
MSTEANQGVVGDIAKLMMHRLIVRQIRRDPTLVERAKIAHARQADQFAGWPFVRKWDELLSLPPSELTRFISRDQEMVPLRNSSPFTSLKESTSETMDPASASDAQREEWWNGGSALINQRKQLRKPKRAAANLTISTGLFKAAERSDRIQCESYPCHKNARAVGP